MLGRVVKLSSTWRLSSQYSFKARSHRTSIRKLSTLGENLDLANENTAKYFDYNRLEPELYKFWASKDYFVPKSKPNNFSKPFVVSMPPPNVTGHLHMGHAIFIALQDIMVRFQRLRGRETLWLPGTDHAGIATQLLVERALEKQGLSRKKMGRDEFLKHVWTWKREKGGYITQQMRRLGASADWSREQFTLDDHYSAAVIDAFVQLHEKSSIYKGSYMVNWSPNLQTAISDLEVEHHEEMGKLYYFKYKLVDAAEGKEGEEEEYIPVATTRPETIIGDEAVCVHPDDPRYAKFVGRRAWVPMMKRTVPVIADTYVDMHFGTGALKITPAHDMSDYDIGQRHPEIFTLQPGENVSQALLRSNMLHKDATINHRGGPRYEGLSREECRMRLWEDLRLADLAVDPASVVKLPPLETQQSDASGKNHVAVLTPDTAAEVAAAPLASHLPSSPLFGTVPHMLRVPRSQRSGEVIEPMLSTQWFLRTASASPGAKQRGSQERSMALKAVDAVRSGKIKIMPSSYERVWYHYLENSHDWCISRQLWWGHRIPVYYLQKVGRQENEPKKGSLPPYIVARSRQEAEKMATVQYKLHVVSEAEAMQWQERHSGAESEKSVYWLKQDDDVLDTWFSSGLWPFATVGWPDGAVEVGDGVPSSSQKEKRRELSRYYPGSVLETGHDILFFWVARMVMLGLELTGKAPFHTVYLHGLVRDAHGQKMSKTKGNVIDPLDAIQEYGTDALRYTLVTNSTPGLDIPLDMEKVEGSRNFVSKLWNIGKFVHHNLSTAADTSVFAVRSSPPQEEKSSPLRSAEGLATLLVPERWIVSKVHVLAEQVTRLLEEDQLNIGEAGRLVHDFLREDFADWYVESSKVRFGPSIDPQQTEQTRRVLVYVWDTCLRLLHPFMPFVTEALWQLLPHEGDSLMVSAWPVCGRGDGSELPVDAVAVTHYEALQAVVRAVRHTRLEYGMEISKKVPQVYFRFHGEASAKEPLCAFFAQETAILSLLGRMESSGIVFLPSERDGDSLLPVHDLRDPRSGQPLGPCVHLILTEGVEVLIPHAGLLDMKKEVARLTKQRGVLEKELAGLKGRLNSQGFVDRAPAELLQQTRDKAVDLEDQLTLVNKSLATLSGQ